MRNLFFFFVTLSFLVSACTSQNKQTSTAATEAKAVWKDTTEMLLVKPENFSVLEIETDKTKGCGYGFFIKFEGVYVDDMSNTPQSFSDTYYVCGGEEIKGKYEKIKKEKVSNFQVSLKSTPSTLTIEGFEVSNRWNNDRPTKEKIWSYKF